MVARSTRQTRRWSVGHVLFLRLLPRHQRNLALFELLAPPGTRIGEFSVYRLEDVKVLLSRAPLHVKRGQDRSPRSHQRSSFTRNAVNASCRAISSERSLARSSRPAERFFSRNWSSSLVDLPDLDKEVHRPRRDSLHIARLFALGQFVQRQQPLARINQSLVSAVQFRVMRFRRGPFRLGRLLNFSGYANPRWRGRIAPSTRLHPGPERLQAEGREGIRIHVVLFKYAF